jgi:hypothetical protein
MAFDFVSYRTGLRQVVGAVLPEVLATAGGGGIWTRPRVEQVPFEDIAVPMVVIQPTAPRESAEWSGLTGQAYEIETFFHYVLRRDLVTDAEEVVEAKLAALADYLLYHTVAGLPKGQCLGVSALDAQEGNEVNRILLEKNLPYYGGTLTALLLAGRNPS